MRGRDAADYQDSGAADLAVDEARLRGAPHCETCGKATRLAVKLCGECAEDWNNPIGGKARIARRRRANGLPALESDR